MEWDKIGGREDIYINVCGRHVLLAENEDEMRSVIERSEKYLGKKNLELNTEKTKIMRFRKDGEKMEKREW